MKRIDYFKCLLCILIISTTFSCSVQSKVRSLKNFSIKKIGLRYDSLLFLPESSHKIGLVAFTQDNRVFTTSGFLRGNLYWKNFIIKAENARFSNGTLEIYKTDAHEKLAYIPLKISTKYEPEIMFHDTIWMNYETGVRIFPTKEYLKSPGSTINFGLEVLYDNNKTIKYSSSKTLKKVLPLYNILVKGGSYHDGSFTISPNIFENPDHTPGFMFELKKDSNIYDTFDIRLNYINIFRVNGSGNRGYWGLSGTSGSNGSTGEHGRHGNDGEYGNNGNSGHDIDVFTDIYFDSILQYQLIKIHTVDLSLNQHRYFLVNPNGGGFILNANGGDGGDGGRGGDGGNGGSGYKGAYYEEIIKETIIKKDTAGKEYKVEITRKIERQKPGNNGGNGGSGGYGGGGGYGGEGGHVIVYYTPAMRNYLQILKTSVAGGRGGSGGNGGSAGKGGAGGQGNPNGRNGNSGMNGRNGEYGYDGRNGIVEYVAVSEIDW